MSPLDGQLVGAILQEVSDNPTRFTLQHVSNIALAAAVLQASPAIPMCVGLMVTSHVCATRVVDLGLCG